MGDASSVADASFILFQTGCQTRTRTTAVAPDDSEESGTIRHRCGRDDAITLSAEAAHDILQTVEQWHTPKHRADMRQALQSEGGLTGQDRESPRAAAEFSAMPTLHSLHVRSEARAAGRGEVRSVVDPESLTEAQQLELAMALSREEAEVDVDEDAQQAKEAEEIAAESATFARLADGTAGCSTLSARPGVVVLPAEGVAPAVAVRLRAHCLGPKVGDLPEEFKISSEQIVRKLLRGGAWVLLYESVAEEFAIRARCAAAVLKTAHPTAIAVTSEVRSGHGSDWLKEALISLPVWRSGNAGDMPDYGGYGTGEGHHFWGKAAAPGPKGEQLWQQQMALLRQVILEFCELEDLCGFIEEQLGLLELAIDTERGIHALAGERKASHTPNIRDLGRLAFRNYCLLDSQLSEPLCLAAYALIRRLHSASEGGREAVKDDLVELLEVLHSMLGDCDVADDDFSDGRRTRDILQKRLVRVVAASLRCYGDWDIKGHPSRDRANRRPHFG